MPTAASHQEFHKYQALGNDMLVLDPATFTLPLTPELIRRLCHRHLGLGADGICYGPLSGLSPHEMRFFNPDGSEAEKSGNGLRIFARYLHDRGYVTGRRFNLRINDETIAVTLEDDHAATLTTTLGRLSFHSQDVPVTGPPREVILEPLSVGGTTYAITAVSIGNPHCVIFHDNPTPALAKEFGPLIETAAFFPQRTNVQFVRVIDPQTIAIQIWERGAGYTLASGTSASAAAGAAVKTGRCHSPVEVHMPGGPARVAIDDDWTAHLTGPVQPIATGHFASALLLSADD